VADDKDGFALHKSEDALLYSLVVLYASLKNKKVEQKLNALLEGSQKEDDSESP